MDNDGFYDPRPIWTNTGIVAAICSRMGQAGIFSGLWVFREVIRSVWVGVRRTYKFVNYRYPRREIHWWVAGQEVAQLGASFRVIQKIANIANATKFSHMCGAQGLNKYGNKFNVVYIICMIQNKAYFVPHLLNRLDNAIYFDHACWWNIIKMYWI